MIKTDVRYPNGAPRMYVRRGVSARNESLFDTFPLSLGPHVEAGRDDKRARRVSIMRRRYLLFVTRYIASVWSVVGVEMSASGSVIESIDAVISA